MSISASPKGLSPVHPAIQKLVDSLTSNAKDEVALVKSLKSLYTLEKNEKNRQQLVLAGSSTVLIELCQGENMTIVENATRCLLPLTHCDEQTLNLIGRMGVAAILGNVGKSHSDVVGNSCKLLAKLAQTEYNRQLVRDQGGLIQLLKCLHREVTPHHRGCICWNLKCCPPSE